VWRVGADPDTPWVLSTAPRHAHLAGFDLHANVWVAAHDRAGLERLCRYVLRPPFAQERLRLRSDGRIALELKTAWHDGTRELVFEPLELLERLVAMTPRPETNLLICHGSALWGPAAPDRHPARSGGHPEDPRAPGDRPLGAEPRPRPARARRRHALIGSARGRPGP
jgi:hypothetical protein